ncbi:MAG: pbpE 2 [Actinomycetia bacterium]|nr:pbpE 2 [Actinomycetes bacterium]
MTAPEFARTIKRAELEVDDGIFTKGAQIVVEVGGERVLDLAMGDSGLGVPMTSEQVLRVYCTIKPITVIAIAQLVERGLLDLDDPLEARLPRCRALAGGVTLRHVLTHTAGLHRPMGIEMEMTVPAVRRQIVEQTPRPTAWRVGVDAAYSEFSGWQMLGWLIEDVTGEPTREYLRHAVLDPLGLHDTWIGMTEADYNAVLPRLGVNHDLREQGSAFPMLFERSRRVCQETNPAHGGYTTARDLARFYTQVLQGIAGNAVAGLPGAATLRQFCSEARPPVYDQVLDRVSPYGLGFMTSLDQHAFSTACGPASFGHSGNVGASFAYADPERDLAVAVVYNGLVGYEVAFLRREALLTALYRDLDDVFAEAEEAEPRGRGLFARLRNRG